MKWVEKLATIEFAINTTYNKLIHMTPYKYLYGFNPTLSFKTFAQSTNAAAMDFDLNIKNTLQLAKDNLMLAKVELAHFANWYCKNLDTFIVGDKVSVLKCAMPNDDKRFSGCTFPYPESIVVDDFGLAL
ncbi:hypothetical protein HK096_005207 [Nowakowskiella sp. JEL0078]|nr:hypothetical protein HK096_005207 [Nowakowskiella sp. JEL0078]